MDFPKSCITNVHAIDDILQSHVRLYTWKDPEVIPEKGCSRIRTRLTELRRHGLLCTNADLDIWIFGRSVDELDPISEEMAPDFDVSDLGMLGDNMLRTLPDNRLVRDLLLESIEKCLAYRLGSVSEVQHIGPWTWTYTSPNAADDECPEAMLMKVEVKLLRDGCLYIIPAIQPSLICPLTKSKRNGKDYKIILAPFAQLGTKLHSSQMPSISEDVWKRSVQHILELEGLRLSDETDWTSVQLNDFSSHSLPWPTELCFTATAEDNSTAINGDDALWTKWFDIGEEATTFKAPFAIAGEWYSTFAQRQDDNLGASGEPVATHETGNAVRGTSDLSAVPDSMMATTPLFTQRTADHQAVVGGIYPTPPDGMATTTGLTQASTDSATTNTQGGLVDTADATLGDEFQLRPQRFDSSVSQPGYLMPHEDLFGDSGELEFGDNEVDDADFSFFDEPDEDVILSPSGDVHMQDQPKREQGSSETSENDQLSAMNQPEPEPSSASKYEDIDTRPQQSMNFHLEAQTGLINTVELNSDSPAVTLVQHKPEKPLSPFGIKERLLPPPVPASIAQKGIHETEGRRRSSTFSPVTFRDGLHFPRYANVDMWGPDVSQALALASPNISLPPGRKKPRALKPTRRVPIEEEKLTSDSEDDSYESSSGESNVDMPPKLPWDSKKRKRRPEDEATTPLAGSTTVSWPNSHDDSIHIGAVSESTIMKTLLQWSQLKQDPDHRFEVSLSLVNELAVERDLAALKHVRPIKHLFDLSDQDLIYIAQLVSEQAVSTTYSPRVLQVDAQEVATQTLSRRQLSDFQQLIGKAIDDVFLQSSLCDLNKVTLIRETPARAVTTSARLSSVQARVSNRPDSSMTGSDYFPVPPPHVKVQRGGDCWEMLPTCLPFWEALGLGPANGPKNVRVFCIFPFNDDVQFAVERFMTDLGTAYESCKLGLHAYHRNYDAKNEFDNYEDGMVPVEMTSEVTFEAALTAYRDASVELGLALTSMADLEPERSIVVYMVNPFNDDRACHYLCACFWQLFITYRDHLPRAQHVQGAKDILLQIIPMSVVAQPDTLVLPEAKQTSLLAREIYDRCPPTPTRKADGMSVLPKLAAPAVELASPASKKVSFQLTTEPPSDLLHEGSFLHLAYSRSQDSQWLSVAWVDSTGQYHNSTAFCVRGRSIADTAAEVWERTREILSLRQITWRVLIVTDDRLDESLVQCWQSLCSKPRAQVLGVTLLSVQTDSLLSLTPTADGQLGLSTSDPNALTPVSTPQGATFTNSPDVSGHANAPPTPAPSETAASVAENDPDAHLVDVTDETWAILFSGKMLEITCPGALAAGALFKRGDTESASDKKLPSLGVVLHWTIQVKPNGVVDEGQARHAEMTIREVLKLYRNLALLTQARGLDNGRTTFMPVHLAVAMRGAAGLNGLLL